MQIRKEESRWKKVKREGVGDTECHLLPRGGLSPYFKLLIGLGRRGGHLLPWCVSSFLGWLLGKRVEIQAWPQWLWQCREEQPVAGGSPWPLMHHRSDHQDAELAGTAFTEEAYVSTEYLLGSYCVPETVSEPACSYMIMSHPLCQKQLFSSFHTQNTKAKLRHPTGSSPWPRRKNRPPSP